MYKNIVVRDLRNGEWSWVYNSLIADPHISASDVRVYAAIASWGGCDTIYPAFEDIAKRASLSKRACISAVKKLEEVGYLSVETGGGRGKANEYKLLKMPKGCKLCTDINYAKNDQKECKKRQETMQNMHPNNISNNISNNINVAEETSASLSVEVNKQIGEVIDAFKGVNPAYKRLFSQKPQREAVERLLNEYGFDKLLQGVKMLPNIITKPYAPRITTPYELERKMGQLIAFSKQEKNITTSKGKEIIF